MQLKLPYKQIMTNIKEILAQNLKGNRRRLGITQPELAERAGMSTQYLAMIEIARKFPTADILERLANALEIEAHELFIVKPTPEAAMERLHDTLASNIEKIVAAAIEKNLAAQFKGKA
jgi:transcriptional regulator with XRE-family HTH domain